MSFVERIARTVRTDDEFLERLARGVGTACQSVRMADERLVNGYPVKNG